MGHPVYTTCLEVTWLPKTANTDIPQPINKFPVSCGTQTFVLPWSQEPITGLYPQPDESSPRLSIFIIYNFHFNITIPSTSRAYKWSLSFTFPNHNPDYFPVLPCRSPALLHLLLPDFIIVMTFSDVHKSRKSSLYNSRHPHAMSSLLGLNTIPNPPPQYMQSRREWVRAPVQNFFHSPHYGRTG